MTEVKHKKLLYVYGAVSIFIMLGIFIMSSQDGSHSGNLSGGFLKSFIGEFLRKILPSLTDKGFEYDIRKYAHMTEYFCLGVSYYLFFAELFRYKSNRLVSAFLSAFSLGFVYACSDEFHQLFVPQRAGRFTDVLVDSVGLAASVIIMQLIFFTVKHLKNKKS